MQLQFTPRVAVSCLSCGSAFIASDARLAAGRGKYCSLQCKRKGRPVPVMLCACGCMVPVTRGSTFRKGHHLRRYDLSATHACACGCGTLIPVITSNYQRPQFVSGHQCRGKIYDGSFRRVDPIDRFWKYVVKSESCWLWIGSKGSRGYGQLHINRKPVRAHRFSWELHYGPIPAGMEVCHHCDNPPCVRPDHFFLGTQADNLKDMVNKGRHWAHLRQASTRIKA